MAKRKQQVYPKPSIEEARLNRKRRMQYRSDAAARRDVVRARLSKECARRANGPAYIAEFLKEVPQDPVPMLASTLLSAASADTDGAVRKECAFPGCPNNALRKWCEQHKRLNECREPSCTKGANYNVPGAGGQWCITHKGEGMVDILHRRCNCGKARPCFGCTGDAHPTCCAKCKKGSMIDLVNRRCECGKARPSFGFEGDDRATCCALCKADNMTDIKKRRCVCGSASPCFGFEGDDRATCCALCKNVNMIDIHNRRCNCGKARPKFGYGSDTRPTCCEICKHDNMIILNRRCNCGKVQPSFGFVGDARATCCALCKDDKMVNIVTRRCNCGKVQPVFGLDGDARATCCALCKDNDMIDVVHARCSCGQSQPSFGFDGDARATCCALCKDNDMTDIVHARCSCGKAQPCFGFEEDNRATCCALCKDNNMINILSRRCEHGRRLSDCLGDICGIKLGCKSIEELFATSTAFFILGEFVGDPLAAYLTCLDQRIDLPDGSYTKPDLLLKKGIVEYDGAFFHREKVEHDSHKTRATTALGYTVTRYRDGGLPAIKGAVNFAVDARKGLEGLARQVATHHGVTMDRQLWLHIDSLARRAILHLQQRYAKVKQTEMTQYMV